MLHVAVHIWLNSDNHVMCVDPNTQANRDSACIQDLACIEDPAFI